MATRKLSLWDRRKIPTRFATRLQAQILEQTPCPECEAVQSSLLFAIVRGRRRTPNDAWLDRRENAPPPSSDGRSHPHDREAIPGTGTRRRIARSWAGRDRLLARRGRDCGRDTIGR